jgi:TetR/AcrR family transcriptional regulator, tetracycline repressor protein
MPMNQRAKRGVPARAGLSREAVLRAALDLVDAEGLEALSVRRLGERLGVTGMAIYNHLDGKQALLDGVADLVAREIESPPPDRPWDERLRAILTSTRAACLNHPHAIPVLQTTRAVTPALLRPAEDALEALADGGFGPDAALEAWAALIALTLGHVGYQLNRHLAGEDDSLPADEFPLITAARASDQFDFDRAFESALGALIRGLGAGP